MELTHFTFDAEDGVAVVLLDRAGEPMNTIGPAIFDDFAAVVDRIETDPSIKAVVFGSAKKGNFLAGADIRFFEIVGAQRSHERCHGEEPFAVAGKEQLGGDDLADSCKLPFRLLVNPGVEQIKIRNHAAANFEKLFTFLILPTSELMLRRLLLGNQA